MIKIHKTHRWNLTYAEALELQNRLCKEVRLKPLPLKNIHYIAGADLAVSKKLGRLAAAVVVMRFPGLEVIEINTVSSPLVFPYIPGLLSFREIPGLIQCFQRVKTSFQVILCDAQGIAHPRRFGLASHLGVLLQIPTVGCAKSRLVGDFPPVGPRKGESAPLTHQGKRVGSVLRTRTGVNPLFVSPGHLVDHPSSRRIVLASTKGCRIPEPTRQAHILAGKYRQQLENRFRKKSSARK